ncbi:SCAN domain-containing protein 3 [Trichinella zimbabwensis]|uniref:SCAN domain-containing protein 3 n=1 Tax=Trichinella zimbabwensis TaxID=268475 RepID=A0A0V1I4L9_9BILA|nr:SCAN domain-containing protein 3 [Trichinella zimbabwensis]
MSEQALKVSGRGTTDFRTTRARDIIAVAWYDNRRVTLTSTYLGVKPLKLKPRWDRKQHKRVMVNVPSIVHNYNMHMGGVDLNNMLSGLYRVSHKSRKWTKIIFFWVIATAATNGWLLYRREYELFSGKKSDSMDLLAFMTSISESLCLTNKALTPQRGRRRGRTVEEVAEPSTSTGARLMPPIVEDAQKDKTAKVKMGEEVASKLLEIFLTFGAPSIPQSDSGRKFFNAIISELKTCWPELKLVTGRPSHPQSQGAVERLNGIVQDKLAIWMQEKSANDGQWD